MDTLLLIGILCGLAAITVLVIYLIDRVNRIEQITLTHSSSPAGAPAQDKPPALFGDLSGRKLWDVVSGKPVEGWDKMAVDQVRNRYQVVLRKHLEELFADGMRDGQAGAASVPKSARVINTLRGSVESWIPQQHAQAVYQVGFDRARAAPDALPALRKKLDDVVETLHMRAEIKLARPLSQDLIPGGGPEGGDSKESEGGAGANLGIGLEAPGMSSPGNGPAADTVGTPPGSTPGTVAAGSRPTSG